MVLLRTNSIDILTNLAEVYRNALQNNLVGFDEIIFQVGIAQVERVRISGHTRTICIPIEQVEGK